MARYVDAKFADKEVLFLNVDETDETSVREHLRWQAQSVHNKLQHLMNSPSNFPGSEKPTRTDTLCIWQS